MKNLKKDQKRFYKEAFLILSQYGTNTTDQYNTAGVVITPFGRLEVHFTSSQHEVYSIFMAFTEPGKFDLRKFKACFSDICGSTGLDEDTLRWNLIGSDPDYILGQLEERLDNLRWLRDPKNMQEIMK